MTHTFEIGTKFCGKDKIGKTGSCLVTKWIIFLLPISSFKVQPKEKTVSDISFSSRRGVTHLTLSLYGIVGGGLRTYPISEEDFEKDIK